MTAGATLYLVSACRSAEEFVAAYRRYADRAGLFVPIAHPLPAGRKGRLALTLDDGSVMIEGDAEILQSSTKPTVLHGRPGMTVKFVGPDEPSKIVIAELEKARLAMKPPPPSVPPRPAPQLPAEPRPAVPPIGGRIDAANALAECVVIGDPSTLVEIGAPRSVTDPGSSKKFVVPSIPSVGAPRPAPATTPPAEPRPRTTSVPPIGPIPKPMPTTISASDSKLTSVGFPIIDKLPAAAPGNATEKQLPAVVVSLADEEATTIGGPPPREPALAAKPAPPRDAEVKTSPLAKIDLRPPAKPAPPRTVEPGPTSTSKTDAQQPAPAPSTEPFPRVAPTTALGTPPVPATSTITTTSTTRTARQSASPLTPLSGSSSGKHKATSIGFPVVRTPFETQPLGLVPPAVPDGNAEPAPPIVPANTTSGRTEMPRGKPGGRSGLMPRQPTPLAPVPVVRSPAKHPAPIIEEEATEIGDAPTPENETVMAGAAYGDAAKAADEAVSAPAQRSGGMRASEILAAIPDADWSMTPDASTPTVMPGKGWTPAAGQSASKSASAIPDPIETASVNEPPPPAAKGPPTGDWTISLDPQEGWSEPSKVDPPARMQPTRGNANTAVASAKPINVVQWEDKPTSVGEAKIEVDATLMEPLAPFDGSLNEPSPFAAPPKAAPAAPPPASFASGGADEPSPFAAAPRHEPLAGISAHNAGVRMPSGPAPLVGSLRAPPSRPFGAVSSPFGGNSFVNPPAPSTASGMRALDGSSPSSMFGEPTRSLAAADAAARKKNILLIGAAVLAVAAGFAAVLLLTGTKDAPTSAQRSGSASVIVPGEGSAAPAVAGSGSAIAEERSDAETSRSGSSAGSGGGSGRTTAAVVVDATDPVDSATKGACKVHVTSTPSAAEIVVNGDKRGTTPADLQLPCGITTTLTVKKARFNNTTRDVLPAPNKPNHVVVKLPRTYFTFRVTSNPPGARITADGRSAGVTPATIRVPGYEPTTLVVTKSGFAATRRSVTARNNNGSHQFTLTKSSKSK